MLNKMLLISRDEQAFYLVVVESASMMVYELMVTSRINIQVDG